MMYSDLDMLDAINSGDLVVEPFYPQMLRNVGLALHLGAELLTPEPTCVIDIKHKVVPSYTKFIMTDDKPYKLEPQGFVLAHTFEKITVSTALAMLIEGRSTTARLGLTVVQTAMLVDPGHHNRSVTLELCNNGPNAIMLYPRMKIARGIIHSLKTPCREAHDHKGKYRAQLTVGEPIFEDEFLELK